MIASGRCSHRFQGLLLPYWLSLCVQARSRFPATALKTTFVARAFAHHDETAITQTSAYFARVVKLAIVSVIPATI